MLSFSPHQIFPGAGVGRQLKLGELKHGFMLTDGLANT